MDPLQLGDLLDFAAQSAALIVAELVAVVAAAAGAAVVLRLDAIGISGLAAISLVASSWLPWMACRCGAQWWAHGGGTRVFTGWDSVKWGRAAGRRPRGRSVSTLSPLVLTMMVVLDSYNPPLS